MEVIRHYSPDYLNNYMETLTRSQQYVARGRVNHADLAFDGDFATVVGPEYRRETVGSLIDALREEMVENEVNDMLYEERMGDLEDAEIDNQLDK